jgi:hypothetical protein
MVDVLCAIRKWTIAGEKSLTAVLGSNWSLDGFEISDNLGPHETCTLVDLGIGSPGGMFSHSDTRCYLPRE